MAVILINWPKNKISLIRFKTVEWWWKNNQPNWVKLFGYSCKDKATVVNKHITTYYNWNIWSVNKISFRFPKKSSGAVTRKVTQYLCRVHDWFTFSIYIYIPKLWLGWKIVCLTLAKLKAVRPLLSLCLSEHFQNLRLV